MNHRPTAVTTRRPLPITILATISALAVLKDLIDLFGKPVGADVQVWFGYRFEGMMAKILTIPHLLIYGYAAYGLLRMTRLGWWVAFIYLLYIPVSFILYMIGYTSGKTWEIVFAAVSILIIALIEIYLYKNRRLFAN